MIVRQQVLLFDNHWQWQYWGVLVSAADETSPAHFRYTIHCVSKKFQPLNSL